MNAAVLVSPGRPLWAPSEVSARGAISYLRPFGKVSSGGAVSLVRAERTTAKPRDVCGCGASPWSALPGPTSSPLHQPAALRCPLAIS